MIRGDLGARCHLLTEQPSHSLVFSRPPGPGIGIGSGEKIPQDLCAEKRVKEPIVPP